MQPIAPPPPRHCAPCELIDDDDLSCLDNVTHILGLELFCLRENGSIKIHKHPIHLTQLCHFS